MDSCFQLSFKEEATILRMDFWLRLKSSSSLEFSMLNLHINNNSAQLETCLRLRIQWSLILTIQNIATTTLKTLSSQSLQQVILLTHKELHHILHLHHDFNQITIRTTFQPNPPKIYD